MLQWIIYNWFDCWHRGIIWAHKENDVLVLTNWGDQRACCWRITVKLVHSRWLFRKWKAHVSQTSKRSILSRDSSFHQWCSYLHVFKCNITFTISDSKTHKALLCGSPYRKSLAALTLRHSNLLSFLKFWLVSTATNTMYTRQKKYAIDNNINITTNQPTTKILWMTLEHLLKMTLTMP